MPSIDAPPPLTAALAASSQRPRSLPLLAGLAALAWLAFSIGLHPLTLPDEGRYVGVAWEMLRSGDWLVPTENGLPFFHKPPLFYWITAASMRLFGVNEWAARAAPLVAAAAGAAVLFYVARRWSGERTARWSVVVLLTMPFFFGAAQYANLDLLVAACIAATIALAGHAALLVRAGEPHRAAVVATWIAAALGLLAKGLIGVVLPGAVIVAWLLVTGQPRTILRLLSPLGIAAFLLLAAPWFIAVQQRHPGFAHFFFVYQHFERFTASGFNNAQPFWFYFAVVPLATLPWSPWLIGSRRRGRADEPAATRLWRRLMWTTVALVLLFFSIPRSKPAGYALPVLFPLAWLIADAIVARWPLDERPPNPRSRRLAFACIAIGTALCLAAVAWAGVAYDRDNTAIGKTLGRLHAPGDPVLFLGEYFFDVPVHARLREPVAVTSNWRDPDIARRDNWRRELAEAAPFAPEVAARVLVDDATGLALRCGRAPLWVLAKVDAEKPVSALPGASRIASVHGVSLWRVEPGGCAATAGGAP
jgi:4-amino-4-deoxy-L-arabinose transferase-like glycosyltransferase